jgi:hypothetical protein
MRINPPFCRFLPKEPKQANRNAAINKKLPKEFTKLVKIHFALPLITYHHIVEDLPAGRPLELIARTSDVTFGYEKGR